MPQDHTGALSGVTYVIPELDDEADVEVAFAAFADTLPAAPKALSIQAITGDTDGALNVMYIHEGTGPVTITLPAGQFEGDKIVGYHLGNAGDTVTLVGGPGVSYQGPQTTDKQYSAITAIWHNGKWVGSPFSSSAVPPSASTGGEIVDLNGRRYHIFKNPGSFTFMSHQNQNLTVAVIGAGGNGVPGAVGDSGEGGYGGEVLLNQPYTAFGQDYIAVTVPNPGETARFGTLTAASGANGIPGTPTPAGPPTVISGDLATVLGVTLVGGDGGNAVGPVNGGLGKGGGGGFDLLASYPQTSYEAHWTTGGPYTYDCSYPARVSWEQVGTKDVYGDGCVNGQCPGGWWCQGGVAGGTCMTMVPVMENRYYCDSGGSLNGTTCSRSCQGDNTQHHSETRWNPCNAGYAESNHVCVDARATGGGLGGPGAVVVSYPL